MLGCDFERYQKIQQLGSDQNFYEKTLSKNQRVARQPAA